MSAAGSLLSAVAPALNVPVREREAGAQRFRVAMVAACPMPSRRGTPLRIERLAEALSARGHQVDIITYHIADDAQVLDVPVHRIFSKPVYWRMPAGPNLRKLFLYDPALAVNLRQVPKAGRFATAHPPPSQGRP